MASRAAFKCRAAIANSTKRQCAQPIALRGMADIIKADVEVEHGRGEWQMYGDLSNYKQGKYQIKTFNKISPIGLAKFPESEYDVRTGDVEAKNAHAILLRSHKLQEEEVPKTVRAIAR
jgi:D-3-phosphoglycerate dehydrogenase